MGNSALTKNERDYSRSSFFSSSLRAMLCLALLSHVLLPET